MVKIIGKTEQDGIVLIPQSSTPVDDNVLYIDINDNKLKIRREGHVPDDIQTSATTEKWETRTLSETDISNKYFELSKEITDNQSIRVFIEGVGIKAEQGVDYSLSGNQVFWSGYLFDGLLETGDKLNIFYY